MKRKKVYYLVLRIEEEYDDGQEALPLGDEPHIPHRRAELFGSGGITVGKAFPCLADTSQALRMAVQCGRKDDTLKDVSHLPLMGLN